MSDSRGQWIWITGASSGIGEALALRFAASGARLILSARREAELARVAARCTAAESVTVLPLDLSLPGTMPGVAARALAIAGRIDVMVHNGGVSQRASASQTPFDVDERLMRVNHLGPVALTKALLPSMLAARSGHFVVVTSVLGTLSIPNRTAYCASKHALHGFFNALRAEVAADGIRVTLAIPGFVRTNLPFHAVADGGRPFAAMDPETERGISPEQCAETIVRAAARGADEVYAGGFKERAALHVNRLLPALFRRIARRRARS
jgi:short-subunit dehydrogenase